MNPKILLSILAMASLNQFARADAVDDLVSRFMTAQKIPGLSLAVLKDGKPIKMKAYGLASIDYDVPTKTDTTFLLASMTKSFTATSIMMLVEQGKISLDSPISTYLPDVPDSWKPITVRNLLSHTAGLKDRFEQVPVDASKWRLNYTTEDMYKSARETAVDFKAGERFQYSDQGFFLLGMIIEKVSGQSYPAFLKAHIFDPLGMANSSTIRLGRIVKGMATGYAQLNGTVYHNTRRTDYGVVSHFGMISNVEDLAKWDEALYGEKLLKKNDIEQMWTPSKLANGNEIYCPYGSYGLGWFIDEFNGHRSVGHGGSTGTAYLRFPEDKLTIIVLTNMEQITGGDAPGIAVEIARKYLPALEWTALQPKTDAFPALRKVFDACIDGLESGTFDEKIYDQPFGAMLKPDMPAQKQGFAQLGPVVKIDFLEGQSWGAGHLVKYRTKFKNATVYATVWFDPDNRISFLKVDPLHKYE